MTAEPVFHGEFDDRLDRLNANFTASLHFLQDGLIAQMRVDKRDVLQAIAELRGEFTELKSQFAELVQRHNALEALVMTHQRQISELTTMVQQMRESMDAHARDLERIVADAFAHQAEETNEKFADVHKVLAEIMRRLPPEQQSR
jgi:chromosome segregation ATPase